MNKFVPDLGTRTSPTKHPVALISTGLFCAWLDRTRVMRRGCNLTMQGFSVEKTKTLPYTLVDSLTDECYWLITESAFKGSLES